MSRWWWVRLGRYVVPQWKGFVAILGLMGSAVLFDVLRPWPVKLIIDHVLDGAPLPGALSWLVSLPGAGSPGGLLGWLTGGTVVLFLGGWLCKTTQDYVQAGVASRMVYAVGGDLFAHLQRLSLRFHGQTTTGDLVQRVTADSACVRRLVIKVGLPLLTSSLTIGTMLAIMWRLDSVLTVVAIGVAPLLGACIWRFAGPMEARAYEQYESQGQVMAFAEQALVALPAVKAFTREPYEDVRFSDAWRRADLAFRRLTVSEIQFKAGTGAVTALGTAGVMVLGGYHAAGGTMTLGGLVVFLSYLASMYAPLETLAYLSAGFADAGAGARRVLEVLDSDDAVAESPHARDLPRDLRGDVGLEQVTFGYEADRPVLHEVSLTASRGETVALVGATGAGKSTLVSLIPRLFDPWGGRVTIDGLDVRDFKLEGLRQQISIVLQDPFILPLTVAENISYGRRDASRSEIEAAAEAANAVDFIRDLPDGYDTMLAERGASLSGGQRQRLAIARALVKNAPVLILDEPTSAVDAATEALLVRALERLRHGRTTFVIAHRLSTVRSADRIVVLDRGRIVEEGGHDELLARRGSYCRLHQAQFSNGGGFDDRSRSGDAS